MDSARCIDRGRTGDLMDIVAELLIEICCSDFIYQGLVHLRSVGVHGITSVGHNERRVLFELRFLEYVKSRR